jgi:thymidylate kinase
MELAAAEPNRFHVVDANETPDAIWSQIQPRLDALLESKGL